MQIGHLLAGVQASAPRSFEPLPTGTYTAIVSGDKVSNTKAGDAMLTMEYTIIDGEFNNRKVWTNMNIGHSDPAVAGRALGDLKALASACNLAEAQTTAELFDIPFALKLGQKPKKDGEKGQMEQTVQGYVGMNISAKPGRLPAAAPAAPIRAPSTAAAPAAPGRAAAAAPPTAPWAKRA
jgi:hypothetical protein